MAQKSSTSEAGNIGVLLVGILLNSFFCGIISKQHYLYWTSGFNDPMYMKILVAAQFSIVVFQSAMDWLFAWNLYIVIYDKGYVSKASTWGSPVNSACQCLLIIMANTFLAYRIYNLTGSRLRTGLVFGLSFTAFLIGVPVTVVGWALTERPDIEVSYTIQRVAIVLWHTLQAIAEFLIMYFLYRALRASRSGLQRSDQVVHHLARSVIQIGLFAIIWAIAGFSTYFLLPKYTFYVLLDTTSGSIYTYMIYDGLLSRPRLRGQMAERSQLELPSQSPLAFNNSSQISRDHYALGRKGSSEAPQGQGAIALMNLADFKTTTQDASESSGINRDDIHERACVPVETSG